MNQSSRTPAGKAAFGAFAAAARSSVETLEGRVFLHAGHGHDAGTGLLGEYFDNKNFTTLKLTRTDPQINFYWDNGSPAAGIGADTFSVRWTGQLLANGSEPHTFFSRTDDGVRVWLNGQLIIDRFVNQNTSVDYASAPINLVAGQKYDIKVEYFEDYGRSAAKLFWQTPTAAKQLIPTEHLFNGQAPTAPAAPTDMQARAASATEVHTSWRENATNETAIEVERSTDGVNFAPRITLAANSTTWADTQVSRETTYYYRVRAVNGVGESGYTNVAQATTPAATTEPPPPPMPGGILRIESGALNSYTDTFGKFWAADTHFNGGTASAVAYEVANTNDDTLFYSRRFGDTFNYSVPVPNGPYTLRLLFADPVYTTSGQRLFNINAEGQRIATNFDIAANGGGKRSMSKSWDLTVSDGRIDVAFDGVVENALVSALELKPRTVATIPAAPSNATASPLSSNEVWVTWADNSSNETSFVIERTTIGGQFAPVATVGGNLRSMIDATAQPNTTYVYRVRAANSAGQSNPSNEATATTPAAPSGNFTQLNWSTVANAPIGRSEALSAVVDDRLYVFGGFSGSNGPVARSDVYDPATNTWTRLPDHPLRLTHSGVAVIARNIYFAGGYIGTGAGYAQQFGTEQVWRFNVDTKAYTRMPDLPARRGGGQLAALNGKLHHVGGNNSSRIDTSDHYVLDVAGGATAWTTARSIPNGRSHAGAVTLNGRIYIVGGQFGNDEGLTTRRDVHEYNPATDTWTAKALLPKGISHIASSTVVFNNRILVFGGETAHGRAIADAYAYDPSSGATTWTTLASLPAARISGVAAVIDNKVFFTGGINSTFAFSQTTWKGVPVE